MKYDLILYSGFYRYTFIFVLYKNPTKIPLHYVTIPLFLREKRKEKLYTKKELKILISFLPRFFFNHQMNNNNEQSKNNNHLNDQLFEVILLDFLGFTALGRCVRIQDLLLKPLDVLRRHAR